jgi:hypothetical protein
MKCRRQPQLYYGSIGRDAIGWLVWIELVFVTFRYAFRSSFFVLTTTFEVVVLKDIVDGRVNRWHAAM